MLSFLSAKYKRRAAGFGSYVALLLPFSISLLCQFLSQPARAQAQADKYRNQSLAPAERLNDLLGRLTLNEKISLLGYESKPVARLNIPAYNWWNEALHGVARAGEATIFPQAIGLAATFNDTLLMEAASVISTEARAKYNLAIKNGRRLQYMGLTFWSPNINIFRDPRWGRGQETYGEDPFLTGSMGTAFIRGMQGADDGLLKTAACAKHYAVHSGPESERHGFNAVVSEKDLRETYLYAFHKLVNAGVESVMCAYNSVNGEPCCISTTLLQHVLRDEWKFKGHVVTDCGALGDVWLGHKALPDAIAVAAAAIRAGVNLDCSELLQENVNTAITRKLLDAKEVDSAVAGILRTEFKLGFFDDPATSKYASYNADSIANDYHQQLSRRLAQQSMVMLKNEKNLLPLDKSKYGAYMVVGPNAASLDALTGNYHGVGSHLVNFVEGIVQAVGKSARVEYDMGCDYRDTVRFGGIWAASRSDVTIAVIGLTPVYEGEEGDAFLAEGGGDRKTLQLPRSQIAYLKALHEGVKTPIIAVVTGGSDVDIASIAPYADAIILTWYPGGQGGNALADILFGNVSPSGRLPVTFYKSLNDLPSYTDYSMNGRTYRYFERPVQFPFGFGLSYSSFSYSWVRKPYVFKDSISFSIAIKNTGSYAADEVAQVYVHYPKKPGMPVKELKAFRRLPLTINENQEVEFRIPISEIKKWDSEKHQWALFPGEYLITVGGNSADERLTASLPLSTDFAAAAH